MGTGVAQRGPDSQTRRRSPMGRTRVIPSPALAGRTKLDDGHNDPARLHVPEWTSPAAIQSWLEYTASIDGEMWAEGGN